MVPQNCSVSHILQNIFVFGRTKIFIEVWSKWWQNFHFRVNYPIKSGLCVQTFVGPLYHLIFSLYEDHENCYAMNLKFSNNRIFFASKVLIVLIGMHANKYLPPIRMIKSLAHTTYIAASQWNSSLWITSALATAAGHGWGVWGSDETSITHQCLIISCSNIKIDQQ